MTLDGFQSVAALCLSKRSPIKRRMRNHDFAGNKASKIDMHGWEPRRSSHLLLINSVNAYVKWVEEIVRIDECRKRLANFTAFKYDSTDLADTA